MAESLCDWNWDIDRGPDWLFVRLKPQGEYAVESLDIAQKLWDLLQQHFTYRLVLDMEHVEMLPSYLIGQLILLHKRIHQREGLLRLCGLSAGCQSALSLCRLESRLPNFRTRAEAVLGSRPSQPR